MPLGHGGCHTWRLKSQPLCWLRLITLTRLMFVLPDEVYKTVMTTKDNDAFQVGFCWIFEVSSPIHVHGRSKPGFPINGSFDLPPQLSLFTPRLPWTATTLQQGMSFSTRGLGMIKLRRQNGRRNSLLHQEVVIPFFWYDWMIWVWSLAQKCDESPCELITLHFHVTHPQGPFEP